MYITFSTFARLHIATISPFTSTMYMHRNPVIPLDTGLPSPSRHKHKPDLRELTQPGALQALTNRIHQRLQLQCSAAGSVAYAIMKVSG